MQRTVANRRGCTEGLVRHSRDTGRLVLGFAVCTVGAVGIYRHGDKVLLAGADMKVRMAYIEDVSVPVEGADFKEPVSAHIASETCRGEGFSAVRRSDG